MSVHCTLHESFFGNILNCFAYHHFSGYILSKALRVKLLLTLTICCNSSKCIWLKTCFSTSNLISRLNSESEFKHIRSCLMNKSDIKKEKQKNWLDFINKNIQLNVVGFFYIFQFQLIMIWMMVNPFERKEKTKLVSNVPIIKWNNNIFVTAFNYMPPFTHMFDVHMFSIQCSARLISLSICDSTIF